MNSKKEVKPIIHKANKIEEAFKKDDTTKILAKVIRSVLKKEDNKYK